jgi:SAM-dependent methyltransferase
MLYNTLGHVYDQDAHKEVATGFYNAIKPTLQTGRDFPVLDLGCGTGLVTELIAQRGCHVTGLDNSKEMLRVARERCGRHGDRAKFRLADMRNFSVAKPAAAAFACADIINHFPSERVVGEVFSAVARALRPGGFFTFDTLNRFCFEAYWRNTTFFHESPAGDIVMDCEWDARRGLGTCWMAIFERTGKHTWRRRDDVLYEKLYSHAVLKRLLRRAGFSRIVARDWSPWDDQHLEPAYDRTLWTAFKGKA